MIALAGAAVGAAQQIGQGNQARAMGDWQMRQAQADAAAEREAATVRADQIRKQGERERSSARAVMAGSGVDTGSGTPIRIEGEIVRNAEEDALNEILYGGRRGTRLEQEGQLAQLAGRNRQQAGYAGAFGSLLSSGARIGSGWSYRTQAPAPVEDRTSGAVRIR